MVKVFQIQIYLYPSIVNFEGYNIVTCQAHPVLVKSGSNVRFVSTCERTKGSLTPCLVPITEALLGGGLCSLLPSTFYPVLPHTESAVLGFVIPFVRTF